MKKCTILLLLLGMLSITSCQKYYLSICQLKIDKNSLASTYVGSPDPRQKNPPQGQRLILEWQIPKDLLTQKPTLHLEVLYQDYSEAKFTYPISHKRGYQVYTLQGEEYLEKKGLLSYKAEIITEDGTIFRKWRHQMWVQVIHLEEPPEIIPQKPSSVWEERDLEEEELEWEEIPTQEMQKDAESSEATDKTSSSVKDQSIQGSVTEMQGSIQEEGKD